MTAGDLAVVVASVLCALGFAALIVVLLRVLDMLKALRTEVAELRRETRPLLADLRTSVDDARDDLERFDRVLGSAEAISDAVSGTTRIAKVAFSTPLIKTIALATGTRRAARRMRGKAAPRPAAAINAGPHDRGATTEEMKGLKRA